MTDLETLDREHLFHPNTNLAAFQKSGPFVLSRGEGIFVWDSHGNRYIEGMAGLWCTSPVGRRGAPRRFASGGGSVAPTSDPGGHVVVVFIAHAGAGATWQAMVVLVSFGLVAVFLAVISGRAVLDGPGDLVLPTAAVAVLASLSGATSTFLSDWVGWWTPIGVVALVGILLATFSDISLTPRSPVTLVLVAVALVSATLLHTTIETAWHPTVTGVQRDDLVIDITAPADGADVPIGPTTVAVVVTGGTIGPTPAAAPPADPEELGIVRIYVDGLVVTDDEGLPRGPIEDCVAGCTSATWELDLDRGPHVVSVEFLTAAGESFSATAAGSPTVALVQVTAG